MRHVFLINPVAGKQDPSTWLVPKIRSASQATGIEAEIVITKHRGHAAELAKSYAQSSDPVTVYTCGGDGTFNEVVQSAVGCDTLYVGCVPCGSGNDYVRNFGPKEPFLDMEAQLTGTTAKVDVIDTTYGYSAAICAAGLDAKVAYGIPKFRRIPFCGGTTAYTLSILQTVMGKLGCPVTVDIDGQVREGTYMMLAICNGRMYGGGYMAAPLGMMDDGLLDVILVKQIPRLKLPSLLASYKVGGHLTADGQVVPEFQQYLSYCRARRVKLKTPADHPIIVTVDGECAPRTELQAQIKPACLNISLPRGVEANAPALSICAADA